MMEPVQPGSEPATPWIRRRFRRLSSALERISCPPFSSTAQLGWLVVVFLASRLIGAILAGSPQIYTRSLLPVTMDPQLYREWATQIIDLGMTPYAEVRMEYPPGALPFILLPNLVAHSQPYLLGFVAEMMLVDAVGLFGLMILARRWGSRLGPWLWVLALPLLGPLSWVRLDIVPAVATIWAMVAADAGRWATVGGVLAFGTLTKIYPAFLFPATWFCSSRRRALTVGFVLVSTIMILPFASSFAGLTSSVVGYHLHRGIHAESTWGSALYAARWLGYPVSVVQDFGAAHLVSGASSLLKWLSNGLSIAALLGVLVIGRSIDRRDSRALAGIMFTTLSLLLVTGSVLSPQYLLWLIALGAVVASAPEATLRLPALLLLPAALLTQILYPFLIRELAWGSTSAVLVLAMRNSVLLTIAFSSVFALWRLNRMEPRETTS